ncbi:butyrophilin subfamily 3 member A2-like isoform X2 [Centropristis striata]|uniref:butyrophilin subfamily 3 member A2-like isoform X2 n=1 Tax=Centropristis striata TaxID=184440 RepID=UPI0027E0591D|nr:butyrophilin subfamily 3 member A2-like isoform X2 [Centropristis striata]
MQQDKWGVLVSFNYQNNKMLLSLQSPVRLLSVLVFHLLLTHLCRGQSQLVGPSQPIVANVGDDIILPCHLEPAEDVAAMTLEWTRLGLKLKLVNVWRDGQDLDTRSPSYRGRTFLFTDELKKGNISLKLSTVKLSDTGRYKCFIPEIDKESFIELVVGAVSLPVINLAGIDRDKEGVVLQCESSGWYPEPELLWLDGEGKLLSAGPTETVRGPDDLYTVSSRVTVEKRHSNSFTCRVHQKDTNHTRETHITVPDDFFKVQSSSSGTTGLAVGLAVSCILVIVLLVILVLKLRQNKTKTKRSRKDTTDGGDQNVTEEEMKTLKGKKKKKSKHKLEEEQQRREEAENRVQVLEEELQTKIRELQDEQSRRKREVQQKEKELQDQTVKLQQETQRKNEALRDVETLKTELENKIKQLEKHLQEEKSLKTNLQNKNTQLEKQFEEEKNRRMKLEKEVESLKTQLQQSSWFWGANKS